MRTKTIFPLSLFYPNDKTFLFSQQHNAQIKSIKSRNLDFIIGGNRCPLTQGGDVNYIATMPFTGSYRRGLPVDLRFELYAAPEPQADCVTKENLSQFGEPFICFIIQGYIL